jgi:hypothetical protein
MKMKFNFNFRADGTSPGDRVSSEVRATVGPTSPQLLHEKRFLPPAIDGAQDETDDETRNREWKSPLEMEGP